MDLGLDHGLALLSVCRSRALHGGLGSSEDDFLYICCFPACVISGSVHTITTAFKIIAFLRVFVDTTYSCKVQIGAVFGSSRPRLPAKEERK